MGSSRASRGRELAPSSRRTPHSVNSVKLPTSALTQNRSSRAIPLLNAQSLHNTRQLPPTLQANTPVYKNPTLRPPFLATRPYSASGIPYFFFCSATSFSLRAMSALLACFAAW